MTNFDLLASQAGFHFDSSNESTKRNCEHFMLLVMHECILALTEQIDHPEELDTDLYYQAKLKVNQHFNLSSTRKIVINNCFGGFGLSDKCLKILSEAKKISNLNEFDLLRDDPLLIKVVEKYGKESWGQFAELKIVEIPTNVKWHIAEYDGLEHVAEDHRTWK